MQFLIWTSPIKNPVNAYASSAAVERLFSRGEVEDTRLEAKDTKKSEAKAKTKDSLSEDRHSRGQGQECSRPRPRTEDTNASVLKKKGLQKYFSGDLQKKNGLEKFFQTIYKILTIQKIVLSSSRGRAEIGLETSRPRLRT